MKAEARGIKAVRIANDIINNALLVIIVALLAFAVYALWDSKQIYYAASKSNYEVYKPDKEGGGNTFKELQAINPEVIAWIDVYGTNIDYPVVQGEENSKYVNTNAEGRYSLTGAIFLDAGNSADFSDFNNILYGHHMDKNVMFGEIGSFAKKSVFDSHRYGNLFTGGKDYGIEFFALVEADAYDRQVFRIKVDEEERMLFLSGLLESAVQKRDVRVTGSDRIVLLTTCSTASTNGREILVGLMTDDVFADPFKNKGTSLGEGQSPIFQYGDIDELCLRLLLLALGLAMLIITLARAKRRSTSD